jgi:hypothetical protein
MQIRRSETVIISKKQQALLSTLLIYVYMLQLANSEPRMDR